MMVTKRLPVSIDSLPTQRLFRLGEYSFGLAVWFGILETYSEAPALRSNDAAAYLETHLARSADLKMVYLWMTTNPGFTVREKLSIWNCSEGISTMKEMFELVLGASAAYLTPTTPALLSLCRTLSLTLLPTPPPLDSPVFSITIQPTSDGAQLLYSSYASDDFYSFSCGCLFLKSNLHFQLSQSVGNRGITLETCSMVFSVCNHTLPIADRLYPMLLTEAKETIDGHSVLFNMKLSSYNVPGSSVSSVCQKCSIGSELLTFCSKECNLCINCWVVNNYSAGYLWCPKCSNALTQRSLKNIHKLKQVKYSNLPEVPTRISNELFLLCKLCRQKFGVENTLIHTNLTHACQICDTCWKQRVVIQRKDTCSICHKQLPSDQIDRIKAYFPVEIEEEKKIFREEKKIFREENNVFKSICKCPIPSISALKRCPHFKSTEINWVLNSHIYCVKCLPCPAKCSTCKSYTDFQCMGCERMVTFDPGEENKVEGLCRAGCVLCVCCIYISRYRALFKCGVCRNKCIARNRDQFEKRRQEKIICCLKNPGGRLERHESGKFKHPKCSLSRKYSNSPSPQRPQKQLPANIAENKHLLSHS